MDPHLRDPARPRLLRPGAITRAELERALGKKVELPTGHARQSKQPKAQLAPGMLKRHYSPRTPIVLHKKFSIPRRGASDEAWVLAAKPAGPSPKNIFWLDAHGELRGAARQLFALLRRLDDGRFKKIHIALARGGGLADAINDRLRRAAAR